MAKAKKTQSKSITAKLTETLLNLGLTQEDINHLLSNVDGLDKCNHISATKIVVEGKAIDYICLLANLQQTLSEHDVFIQITYEDDYSSIKLSGQNLIAALDAEQDPFKCIEIAIKFAIAKQDAIKNINLFKKANQELTDMRIAGESDIHAFLAKRHNKKSSKKAGAAYA